MRRVRGARAGIGCPAASINPLTAAEHGRCKAVFPGYEGWTDNTDPVGAFDGYGSYYELILPYMFFYNKDTAHYFTVGKSQEPNMIRPAEVISVAVRRHGATGAAQWITSRNGQPDIVSLYDSKGREPDKQWITIDTNPASPNYNTIYVMWVVFNRALWQQTVRVHRPRRCLAAPAPDWSAPRLLPTMNSTAADTYLLPHVDPSGVAYTTVANFPGRHQRSTANFRPGLFDGRRTNMAGSARYCNRRYYFCAINICEHNLPIWYY